MMKGRLGSKTLVMCTWLFAAGIQIRVSYQTVSAGKMGLSFVCFINIFLVGDDNSVAIFGEIWVLSREIF